MDAIKAFSKTSTAAVLRTAAARGTLHHALIFSGPGDRVNAARYAAAAMECTAPVRPCLTCAHCRKVLADVHPDVRFVRDPEHKELSVEVVRGVRTDAFVRPNEGARKVYIFEDCSILNEKDQSVLLKVVEEGPPYAAFLFCAENAMVLLQTIRSRCLELRLAPADNAADGARDRAAELCRLAAEGSAADRAAFFMRLAKEKDVTREAMAALCEQTRLLFAGALLALYGQPPPAETRALTALLTQRLTKAQIVGTIDLLENYHRHFTYNVGVGLSLGALAAEWEELF